jgi:hypothetical protein
MFMNEVLTSLGPANVAVFDGICTVLGSDQLCKDVPGLYGSEA